MRFKLDVMRQKIDSDNNALVALDPDTLRPLHGDLENVVTIDEPFKKDLDLYMATLDWNIGWANLTSASAYSHATTDQRQDATFLVGDFPLLLGLPPGLSYFDLGLGLDKFTQELRLTSTAAQGRFAGYVWHRAPEKLPTAAYRDRTLVRLVGVAGGDEFG